MQRPLHVDPALRWIDGACAAVENVGWGGLPLGWKAVTLPREREVDMKKILAIWIFAALAASFAQAGEGALQVSARTVGDTGRNFPRVAVDQSRVVKKRLRTSVNRNCVCKRRCNGGSGCYLDPSSGCYPGEYYPDPCGDCVTVGCS